MGINWKSFHHPDLCLPVIQRKIGNELLDLFATFGEVLVSNGRSLTWNSSLPNQSAYYSATYRLRKAGLLAYRKSDGQTPVLMITEEGKRSLSGAREPEKLWNAKWGGIWYVLTYDVPEKDRLYRDTLRRFLGLMRMGCLHKSVWVAPRDIRPEYGDLVEASGVDSFSYLLEAKTVLGRPASEIVQNAWDFERLGEVQRRYIKVYSQNLEQLCRRDVSPEEATTLARQELEAYRHAMYGDPLLPQALHPSGYLGRGVWQLHRKLVREVTRRL